MSRRSRLAGDWDGARRLCGGSPASRLLQGEDGRGKRDRSRTGRSDRRRPREVGWEEGGAIIRVNRHRAGHRGGCQGASRRAGGDEERIRMRVRGREAWGRRGKVRIRFIRAMKSRGRRRGGGEERGVARRGCSDSGLGEAAERVSLRTSAPPSRLHQPRGRLALPARVFLDRERWTSSPVTAARLWPDYTAFTAAEAKERTPR